MVKGILGKRGGVQGGDKSDKNKTSRLLGAPVEEQEQVERQPKQCYFISVMGHNNRCTFHHVSCGVIIRLAQ